MSLWDWLDVNLLSRYLQSFVTEHWLWSKTLFYVFKYTSAHLRIDQIKCLTFLTGMMFPGNKSERRWFDGKAILTKLSQALEMVFAGQSEKNDKTEQISSTQVSIEDSGITLNDKKIIIQNYSHLKQHSTELVWTDHWVNCTGTKLHGLCVIPNIWTECLLTEHKRILLV